MGKTFGPGNGYSEYDYINTSVFDIIETNDGNFIAVGTIDRDSVNKVAEWFIVKFDSNGNMIWNKFMLPFTPPNWSTKYFSNHGAFSIEKTNDGNYLIFGKYGFYTSNNEYPNYLYIVKINDNGDSLLAKNYSFRYYGGVVKKQNGNFLLAGSVNSDPAIFEINENGDSVTTHIYNEIPGSGSVKTIDVTLDGNYIISGQHYYNFNFYTFFGKIDNLGNLLFYADINDLYSLEKLKQTSEEKFIGAGMNSWDIVALKFSPLLYEKHKQDILCAGTNSGWAEVNLISGYEPLSLQWSTDDTTSLIDSLSGGAYAFTITDGFGNEVIDSVIINEPDTLTVSLNVSGITCHDDNDGHIQASISGGVEPYTFSWNTGDTSLDLQNLGEGTYIINVSDANGCFVSDTAIITNPPELQYEIELSLPSQCINSCDGEAIIHVTGGTPPYSFNTYGAYNEQDSIITLCNYNQGYYFDVYDSHNCNIYDNFSIPYFSATTTICMVTIDTATEKCLVKWNKPQTVEILSGFKIYKETGNNLFEEVGFTPWENESEFLDTTSNPMMYAQAYKISAVDTCGNETQLSVYHRTMYLSANQGANPNEIVLSWTNYQIGNSSINPLRYYIYRKTLPDNPNYQLIDSIPGSLNNYTDLNVPVGYNYYIVAFDNDIECSQNKAKANNKVFSNPYEYNTVSTQDQTVVFVPLKVYPNPFSDKTTIEFYNPNNELFSVKLLNLSGKIVYSSSVSKNKFEILRNQLTSGTYELVVSNGNVVYIKKIIIK